MPVIALFPLIVVAQDTFTSYHEGQPVLEGVLAAGNWRGQVPQHDLEESRIIYHRAGLLDQFGLHVVMDNNRQWCCQSEQHAPSKRTGEDALPARPAWLHRDVS